MNQEPPQFEPGNLVVARGREWVVMPGTHGDLLRLRPLGGGEDDVTVVYVPLEPEAPRPATFPLPDASQAGGQAAALLMRDALRLKLRAGAGPFRSFGNLNVEPRAYQLVPLLMGLRQEIVRVLIADDVGVGKTIEAGLIVRELMDRGDIERLAVICPPHLCEQWQDELATKFNISTEVVRTGTAARLERGLPAGQSIFEVYPHTVVSLDYIKAERRRDDFVRACPELVIVDEAHTCVGAAGTARHLRYRLLQELTRDAARHMVFLTATPHSGDDQAFHNLLGLLDPRFAALADLGEGPERNKLREELASYFVQRRRQDIPEWRESADIFPDRETREATYQLTGAWGSLFDEVLDYARGMVERAEGLGRLRQRMSWWAALALLRCVSSSPAAASMALRTRLAAVEGESEEEQLADLERAAADTVLDGESSDELSLDETVPKGTVDDAAVDSPEARALQRLIEQADSLRGPKNDPKLAVLADEVRRLVADGFRPVVFCRYIATAHYVAEHLTALLGEANVLVSAVTGELSPDERDQRVLRLGDPDETEGRTPILVATDCLSEGINLQKTFNAVVHYDLVWNPTRHEQREGRVDRFGQPDRTVRALMLYGANNPVDGAVLRVILRKAEKIRKELGITVPVPTDNNKIVEAIMQAVLLRTGGIGAASRQLSLELDSIDEEVERAWESAKEKAREGQRTVFAQRRLRPEEVLPEWDKAVSVLGGSGDVERFMRTAAERLQAPLERLKGHYKLPVPHLPAPLKERLAALDIEKPFRLAFRQPAPTGFEFLYRTHPLVATIADYVAEQALAEENPDLAARSSVLFTDAVTERTTVLLLRLRNQVLVERLSGGRPGQRRSLLAEECLTVRVDGDAAEILGEEESVRLMSTEPSRNMAPEQRQQQVSRALDQLPQLELALNQIAEQRAAELLADHTRVREAGRGRSDALGARYDVRPSLPVDVIGVYVLIPTPRL